MINELVRGVSGKYLRDNHTMNGITFLEFIQGVGQLSNHNITATTY